MKENFFKGKEKSRDKTPEEEKKGLEPGRRRSSYLASPRIMKNFIAGASYENRSNSPSNSSLGSGGGS